MLCYKLTASTSVCFSNGRTRIILIYFYKMFLTIIRRRLEKRIYIPLPKFESRKELIKINLRTVEVNIKSTLFFLMLAKDRTQCIISLFALSPL
jgi:AAA+ superfamily predicted ATPase